jgi:hypothetical protein
MLVRMERKRNPHTWLWEYELVQPLWKSVWRFLKKLKIEPPYDPTVPLLGTYVKPATSAHNTNICTLLFIATLS